VKKGVPEKMPQEFDFDRAWLDKFSNCLDEATGEKVRTQVMAGSEGLSEDTSRGEAITWTQGAMERLESLLDDSQCRAVMTGCACQYPKSDLQDVREAYEASGDVDLAHRMLQEKFEKFLINVLHLSDEHFEAVVSRGWGLAGILEDYTITATKTPRAVSWCSTWTKVTRRRRGNTTATAHAFGMRLDMVKPCR
jgi:hypothetical protein